MAAIQWFFRSGGLTGGGGALDGINTTGIVVKKMAISADSTFSYCHEFVPASSDAENSPLVIKPDVGDTLGRWHLRGVPVQGLPDSGTWSLSTNLILNGAGFNFSDGELVRPKIKDYSLVVKAHGASGSSELFDCENGNFHTVTLNDDCVFSFANFPATGSYGKITLQITQGASVWDVTWPAAVVWSKGITPALSEVGGIYTVSISTVDAGTILYGDIDNRQSNEIAYKAAITGSVQRTLNDKFDEAVSIKDFGGVADGDTVKTDNNAAFQAAASSGKVVYFPEGVYWCTGIISGTDGSFIGAGKGKTVIYSSPTNKYILTPLAGSKKCLVVKGITFKQDNQNLGSCLTFNFVNLISGGVIENPTLQRVIIDDVDIRGDLDSLTHDWRYGIIFYDASNVYINNFYYQGNYHLTAPLGIGIFSSSPTADKNDNFFITNSVCNYAKLGFQGFNTTNVKIDNCILYEVETGIEIIRTSAAYLNGLNVTNCEITFHHEGINLDYVNVGDISGNDFYVSPTVNSGVPIGVSLVNAKGLSITDNYFYSNYVASSRYAIQCAGAQTLTVVKGNKYDGNWTSGANVTAACSDLNLGVNYPLSSITEAIVSGSASGVIREYRDIMPVRASAFFDMTDVSPITPDKKVNITSIVKPLTGKIVVTMPAGLFSDKFYHVSVQCDRYLGPPDQGGNLFGQSPSVINDSATQFTMYFVYETTGAVTYYDPLQVSFTVAGT
ncbi:right-handed parallel beta-helix repeat-containing protein [Candidatus Pacearchaeota archaeon]|nr:right-handed parallel beta-helix repeat-containing protein [Candidatus Pacearchaeota archaeon]